MANFFTDNPDLQFYLDHWDWREVVERKENQFADVGTYDDAPHDYEDALDNYKRVLELFGEICGERIAPRASEVDEEGCHLENGNVRYAAGVQAAIDELSKSDLMGFTMPRRYGGLNLPTFLYNFAIEMISRADASLMTIFGLQDISETIYAYGDEETCAEVLPKFCTGEVTGAMVLTEPDAGSDLQAVALRAIEDSESGCWRLNGVKRFISNGCGQMQLVLARSDTSKGARGLSLFLCEAGPEVKIRRLEHKLGIKGSPTCEIQYIDAPAQLIGKRKRGLTQYVMSLMNGARLGVAGQSVGIAQAAHNAALDFANAREQFGKRIKDIPPVGDMLAEMAVRIEGARVLNFDTARIVDLERFLEEEIEHEPPEDREAFKALKERQSKLKRFAGMLTPMAKFFGTEMCQKASTDAIQVLGGSGYMRDYPLERHFRDARITNIYEGTSQLQVVAAILGVASGTWAEFVAELDQRTAQTTEKDLLETLRRATQQLQETIEKYNAEDVEFRQLYARDLVEACQEVVIGYLLLETAEYADRKKQIARRFITQSIPQIQMHRARVETGERSTIENLAEILGEG